MAALHISVDAVLQSFMLLSAGANRTAGPSGSDFIKSQVNVLE